MLNHCCHLEFNHAKNKTKQTWYVNSKFSLFRLTVVYSGNTIRIVIVWCDFDRASSLICGNIPTRCNRWFLYCRSYCLLNMFRAPLCPSSGVQEYYTGDCCLWYLVLWSSRCGSGVELWVVCPVCGSGTIMPIIRSSRVLYKWFLPVVIRCFGFQVVGLVWSCGLCVRFAF